MAHKTLLTKFESKRLSDLEGVIDAGKQTFLEVGLALAEIRNERLYRTTHNTFEDYCRERHQFGRQRASALIRAATAADDVSEISDTHPNEAQAKVLSAVPADARGPIWKESVETAPRGSKGEPKVSAAHVEKVIASRAKPVPATRDAVGRAIEHDDVVAAFQQRDVFKDLMTRLSTIKSHLADLAASPWGRFIPAQQITADAKNIRDALRFAMPYAVCPYCGGRKCDACKQAGWMGENVYAAVPAELKRTEATGAA